MGGLGGGGGGGVGLHMAPSPQLYPSEEAFYSLHTREAIQHLK
jgi:hypothetical protein